jgi:hypothetical protein
MRLDSPLAYWLMVGPRARPAGDQGLLRWLGPGGRHAAKATGEPNPALTRKGGTSAAGAGR